MSLPVTATECFWVGKGVRAARRRRPLTGVIATAVEAQQIKIAVDAAEDAAKKSDAARAARVARATEQPRAGGRFVKGAGKKAAGGVRAEVGGGAEGGEAARATRLPIRSVEERLRAENKYVRKKLAALIEEHNAGKRKDASSETAELLQRCQAKLQDQEGELRRLRRRVQAYKFKVASAALHTPQSSKTPRPIGGMFGPTLLKMANELNAYLETRFSSQESIQQALFQHNKRNRHLYSLILAADIDQTQFDTICSQNPSWCLPIQKAVVAEIAAHYILARCLTLQIQCRVEYRKSTKTLSISWEKFTTQKPRNGNEWRLVTRRAQKRRGYTYLFSEARMLPLGTGRRSTRRTPFFRTRRARLLGCRTSKPYSGRR
jgi:hypothetical protein